MTDPKVLCDALVEAGIVTDIATCGHVSILPVAPDADDCVKTFLETVNDWRVAGACIESDPHPYTIVHLENAVRCEVEVYSGDEEAPPAFVKATSEKAPRAIIEAWYAARREG